VRRRERPQDGCERRHRGRNRTLSTRRNRTGIGRDSGRWRSCHGGARGLRRRWSVVANHLRRFSNVILSHLRVLCRPEAKDPATMLKVVALPRRAVADAKDHGITAALGALRSTNAVCGASSVRRCASVQAVQSRPSGGHVMTIRAQIQIQMLRCGCCCSLSQRHSSPAKCEKSLG
jgi:hypothetical protein